MEFGRATEKKRPAGIYVPTWTDPAWQDEGPVRNRTDWPLNDPIIDRLRPAMLDADQAQKPTEYARRFGIFPFRTDGRSCTSPTRSLSRSLPPRRPQAQNVSQNTKTNADNTVADGTPTPTSKDENDGSRAANNLKFEDFWQGCMFGDITMDELLAGDHFSMGGFQSDLSGPLHPFLQRGKWDSGPPPRGPRNWYNMGGERFEINAHNNNKVWDAMQPALQLATRIINANPVFFSALADITHWYQLPETIDKRPERSVLPKFKFELAKDEKRSVGYKSGAKPTAAFKPILYNSRVLGERLRWRLASGHYNSEEAEFCRLGACGETSLCQGRWIDVNISSELVWQLITDKFSSSEKMMTSYILAVTIVHELCHASVYATKTWLLQPERYGVTDAADLNFCQSIKDELWPEGVSSGEPFFQNDTVAEVGHAFENHVLGCGVWPGGGPPGRRPQPHFMFWHGGIAVGCDGTYLQANEPGLDMPLRLDEGFLTYIQHGHSQRFFRQEFWDTQVAKHGTAALRNAPSNPSRVSFSPESSETVDRFLPILNFGTAEDRELFQEFLADMNREGQKILRQYVRALLYDVCRLELMARRFMRIVERWEGKRRDIKLSCGMLLMVAYEAWTFYVLKDGRGTDENQGRICRDTHRLWHDVGKTEMHYADHISASLQGPLDHFVSKIKEGGDEYDERLTTALMNLSPLMQHEIGMQQSMVCELYGLPAEFWKFYQRGVPGHQAIWLMRIGSILFKMKYLLAILDKIQDHLPSWRNEWRAKFTSWMSSLNAIHALIHRDTRTVHKNWREMLVTVPMLRKSQRKPWERLYSIAKKATLNLTGHMLIRLDYFRERFEEVLNVAEYKITLPEDDPDIQEFGERWAGLLGDAVDFERSEAELMKSFDERAIDHMLEVLEDDKDKAIRAERERAEEWIKKPPVPRTVQWNAQAQEAIAYIQSVEQRRQRKNDVRKRQVGQAGPSTPQITRAMMSRHPTPLTGLQRTAAGRPRRGFRSPGAEAAAQRPRAPRAINSVDELARHASADIENTFAPAGGVPRPVPREYEISGDVLHELAERIDEDMVMMEVDNPSQEALEELRKDMRRYRESHARALGEAQEWTAVAEKIAKEEKKMREEKRRKARSKDAGGKHDVATDDG